MVIAAGATSTHRIGLVRPVLPGSKSRANAYWGSLGTWELPLISAPNRRQGPSGLTSPRLVDGAPGIHESERPERKERYRHAKETERAGWTREVLAPS